MRRLEESSAWAAARDAALDLTGHGAFATLDELVERVMAQGFSPATAHGAVKAHARDASGVLFRVQPGLYRRRRDGEVPSVGRGNARDHVLEALRELRATAEMPVSRRQVELHLAAKGFRYSERAVNMGLTQLVRDPATDVSMPHRSSYALSC